jgi:hypothetical protein
MRWHATAPVPPHPTAHQTTRLPSRSEQHRPALTWIATVSGAARRSVRSAVTNAPSREQGASKGAPGTAVRGPVSVVQLPAPPQAPYMPLQPQFARRSGSCEPLRCSNSHLAC